MLKQLTEKLRAVESHIEHKADELNQLHRLKRSLQISINRVKLLRTIPEHYDDFPLQEEACARKMPRVGPQYQAVIPDLLNVSNLQGVTHGSVSKVV
jgi:restriction endonuclease S subunit